MDGFSTFVSTFLRRISHFGQWRLAPGAASYELRVPNWCPRVHHVSTGMPPFSDKPIRGIVFDLDGERLLYSYTSTRTERDTKLRTYGATTQPSWFVTRGVAKIVVDDIALPSGGGEACYLVASQSRTHGVAAGVLHVRNALRDFERLLDCLLLVSPHVCPSYDTSVVRSTYTADNCSSTGHLPRKIL